MSSIYNRLDQIKFLRKSYTLKFLFVAFIGIHIPLIGMICFLQFNPDHQFSSIYVIILTLLFTLIAAASTLFVLKNLLNPLSLSKNALRDFTLHNKLPDLPQNHEDEVGELMQLIQKTMISLNNLMKEKQEITTLVSHNLRSPLTQIIGLSELLKDETEGEQKLYVEQISSVAKLQLEGLDDLLNQLMHDDFNLNIYEAEPYDLTEVIQKEIELCQVGLERKAIKLNFKHQKPHLTRISASKIALVVQNLLSNAIKFSFENSEIDVEIRNKNQKIEISVRDYGVGFDKEYQKNLFNDARKTGRKGTKDEPSVGLGLHLCKRTMEQVGVKLTGESAGKNQGATFSMFI